MGLFDIFRKKEAPTVDQSGKILLAMPMFMNGDSYVLKDVIENLQSFWGLTITEIDGNDQTAIFYINGEMVALAHMPVPIPLGDIKSTAQYAYNWQTAEKDLESHTGHTIVSVLAGTEGKGQLERFQILSKLLCAILQTSNAIGIYQGNQSLLITKEQYLENIEELRDGGAPVILWIYFGIRKSGKTNSAYTYGLTNFVKQEMEIVNSSLGLEEIIDFLTNITSYVVENDITLKSGETLGYTADQKIKITSSKGHFVDGHSLKLEM